MLPLTLGLNGDHYNIGGDTPKEGRAGRRG